MAIPCSLAQRESEKFVECPSGSGQPAVRTKICQDDGDTINVDLKPRGEVIYTYNEVSGIANGVETKINEYTVPAGKKFDLNDIACSGENISRFIIKKDGDPIKSKRTYWSDFNADFNLSELTFLAGEKIQVFVINYGKGVSGYESTIMGNVYNE